MSSSRYRAWAHIPSVAQSAQVPMWRDNLAALLADADNKNTLLPFGNGRSYGDSCLNSKGGLIDSKQLDRMLAFDREQGIVQVEAGISFEALLQCTVPHGWFLPVSPGTSQVSVGGAIANDVHGKNHHCDGSFGHFVQSITLLSSTGAVRECSLDTNKDLFCATIGGLGLTGFIASATIRLLRIDSTNMNVRTDVFHGLEEFAQLSKERRDDYRYTVAWLDCASNKRAFARGIFLSANHGTDGEKVAAQSGHKVSIPLSFPRFALNRYTIRAFNELYFRAQARHDGKTLSRHYQSYFYPLDAVGQWNRIYGRGGFHQYQFVVPLSEMAAMESIIKRIVESGLGSFLAVLKEFGSQVSPGMLSFPREGYCLALDFANRGEKTQRLINELDQMVLGAGGAAYPAKDRLMSAESFAAYFPRLSEFKAHVDPKFSSDFWRRVHG